MKSVSAVNPLSPWIRQKTGGKPLEQYQLEKIRETVRYAKENSPFYRRHLAGIEEDRIRTMADFSRSPLTGAGDIVNNGEEMCCVHPGQIERIVTIKTSGTTGEPKRIYFTKEDQELTVDFFHHGMQCLIGRDDRFLILLPCLTPGSVGALLACGLERLGCEIHRYGLPTDLHKTCAYMDDYKITSLVGSPVHVLKLAEASITAGRKIRLQSVLLSTDYVPDAINKRLTELWGCKVYEHYGMTEMCFGGGVSCGFGNGYHLREADLYFEVVSPSGEALPHGEYGEIVFTTLTRRGMPLIRYKTGDYGRLKQETCACGDLKLMEKVPRRMDGGVRLKNGKIIFMDELDEMIFSYDRVTDYHAQVTDGKLKITIYKMREAEELKNGIGQRIACFVGMDVDIAVKEQENILQDALMKRKFV